MRGELFRLALARATKLDEEQCAAAVRMFHRRVEKTEPDDEHFTRVWLSCGHDTLVICYQPVAEMFCAQCVHELLERTDESNI
jgi:hypothetical protein